MRKGKEKVTGSKVCNWETRRGAEHPDCSHSSLDISEVPMDVALPGVKV